MTWVAFGLGAVVGVVFTIFTLAIAFVCSRDARHEERVAKYVAAEQTDSA